MKLKKDHGGGAKGGMVKDHTFPPNSVPFPSVFVNKVRGGRREGQPLISRVLFAKPIKTLQKQNGSDVEKNSNYGAGGGGIV